MDCFNISTKPLEYLVEEELSQVNSRAVHFLSAHAVVEAWKSIELVEVLISGKNICDSRPLSLYLKKIVRPTPQVRGSDFMKSMLSNSTQESRHFFLGSDLKTLSGIEIYILNNCKNVPNMYFYSPSYIVPWKDSITDWVEKILEFNPNYVWVGMGAPKQFLIADQLWKSTGIPVYSVGAAFDFIGGTKRECPKIVANLGFEWLFRLISEPRRLWKRYLMGNLIFLKILAIDFWQRKYDEFRYFRSKND